MYKRSLTQTLIKYIISIGVCVCFVTAFIGYQIFLYKSNRQYEYTLQESLNYLQDSLELPVWYLDSDSLEKICTSFAKNETVGFIQVLDEYENILFAINMNRGKQFIQGGLPIHHKEKKIGRVIVGLSSYVYDKNNKELLISSIAMTLIAIIGIAILTNIFFKLLLRKPVDDFINKINKIATGDYTPFSDKQIHLYKETGTILSKFNEMSLLIRKREDSLTKANNKLKQEVHDRKEAQQELLKWSHVFKNAQWGIAACGVDNTLDLLNPAYAKMHGYSQKELEGKNIAIHFHPNFHAQLNNITQVSHAKEHYTFEAEHIRKDGSLFPVFHDVTVVRDINKKAIYSIINLQDLTSQKEDEKERQKIENKLRQSQKMEAIGQLAGGIAHDFNNILYPIMGFAELSQDELPKQHPVHENLQNIIEGAQRASDLVKRILLFARQEEQTLQPTLLQPIIKESFKLLRSTIPTYINLNMHLYDGEDLVLCDPSEIHEIILNLCMNSYHSIDDDKGKISIYLHKKLLPYTAETPHHNYLCIEVKDTGKGIPKKLQEKIFEPYVTTKDIGKGSGLGLSIVYGIVQKYNGKIIINSALQQGTSIEICLPMTTQHQAEVSTNLLPNKSINSGNERILFVDDEESIVTLGVRFLEKKGYSVTGMTSSTEAYSVFAADPENFDLIITDMAMPEMLGSQLALNILKIKPTIPIMICSGYSQKLDKIKTKELNIKAFIDKPILYSELVTKVRNVLDEKHIFSPEHTPPS